MVQVLIRYRTLATALALYAVAHPAFAAATGMPWEQGLTRARVSIGGITLLGGAVIGVAAAVVHHMKHGDLTESAHRIGTTAVLAGLGGGAATFLGAMGVVGALI